MTRALLALVAVVGAMLGAGPAAASCAGAPAACEMPEGSYHVRLPEMPSSAPAVLFLHGYGGRGAATIGNDRIVAPMLARGYAVIAPNGIPRQDDGPNAWNFLPDWDARDERAFLAGVADDAARRFGLDRSRMMLAGFSSGGFMVTYLACAAPGTFAAYAPVAGGFWRPHPDECAGPVDLLHSHGWMDGTVPLEGRPLGSAFQQGDIFAGLEIFRRANGCAAHRPDETASDGRFWRRVWDACGSGGSLQFLLFPGGHTVPEGWSDLALDWFESRSATD